MKQGPAVSSASRYPRVRVQGTAFERGLQYGTLARDRIHHSLDGYRAVFGSEFGLDWSSVRTTASSFEPIVREYFPRYVEEIRGIAEGAGVDSEEILALNVRTEVMYSTKAGEVTDGAGRGYLECTSLVALPSATTNTHTLIAQNWDWLLHADRTVVVLEVIQDQDLPRYVTVVEAGLLAKIGMNEAGLGLATNALVTDHDSGDPQLPYHFLLRAILDCALPSDAVGVVQLGPRASSGNFLIAHDSGVAIDLETAPGAFDHVYLQFPNDGGLVHANHFISDINPLRDVSIAVMPDSPFRMAAAASTFQTQDGCKISVEDIMGVLRNHGNYPLSICAHADLRMGEYERSATNASVIMDLTDRVMWLAEGNPCILPYRRIAYSDFL